MEDSLIPILIIAGIINLAIFFAVIFYAVRMANKPLQRYLRILINLKADDLRKQGLEPNKAVEDVDNLDALLKQFSNGQITQEQFNYQAEKYLI